MKHCAFILLALAACGPVPHYKTSYGTRVFYSHDMEPRLWDQAQLQMAQDEVKRWAPDAIEVEEWQVDKAFKRLSVVLTEDPVPCYEAPEHGCGGQYRWDSAYVWYRTQCFARTTLVHELWHGLLVPILRDRGHSRTEVFGEVTQWINNELQEAFWESCEEIPKPLPGDPG